MKLNAHKQTFFQSFHILFSLAPYGNSTKYTHADIVSVHSLRFSHATWTSGNLASTIVHTLTFYSSRHRLLWDINMRSDFCSYL